MINPINTPNPNQPIQGLGEHRITVTEGNDPGQAMPAKKGVLDRITSSKAFDVAKIAAKIGGGVVGVAVLFSLLPATMVLYLLIAGFGAPFGAHITAGEGENQRKLDSIDVGDAMVNMHYEAITSVIDWMKPSAKKETPPGKEELDIRETPKPNPYPHTDFAINYDGEEDEKNTPDGGKVEHFSNPFAESEETGTDSSASSESLQDEIEKRKIQNHLHPPNQMH